MRFLKSWRAPRATLAAASGLAIAAASLTAAAPAAQAAVSGFVNGPVGVTQNITVTGLSLTELGQSTCTIVPSINNVQQSAVQGPFTSTGDSGQATFQWTPLSPGAATLTLSPNCTGTFNPGAVTISPVSTTTTISAPNTAKVGTATQITVTVQSQSPSTNQPQGSVVIKDANGATITSMGLTNGPGTGQSYAYYWWTPTAPGQYIIQATYQPSGGNATASTSAQDIIQATPSGGTISLKAPGTLTQGVPITLTATVFPANVQGTVGFTLNGNPISAAIPIVNGVANFTWTPNVAGQVTLGASYTTNQGGSGSTTDVVTISGAPAQSDSITLVQPGWGPWAPNGSYTLGNGSNFAFQASTLSGAPVTLSETGPCQVSGLTINVPVGSGVCNLQASSPGGNGYAPVTFGYTVNLIPGVQVANIAAPPSGRFKVGRVLVLESPGQADTNAGQNIGWKVQKKGGGRKHCKLLYPDNGSVTLRIASKGSCTVIGSAPGVAGQWQPFKTARNYTGR
jgi:hypothetical protein